MRALRTAVISASFLMGVLGVAGNSQLSQSPLPSQGIPPSRNPSGTQPMGTPDSLGNDPMGARIEEQQARSRNSDRQKRLVADTDKLMDLVKQLKEQVEKPDEPMPPAEVEKRAEEIEKLAKSVKDRMKG